MAEVASFGESKSANRERTMMRLTVMSKTLQLRSHKGPNFSVCLVFFIQSLLYDPKVLGEVVMIINTGEKIYEERFDSQDIEDRVDTCRRRSTRQSVRSLELSLFRKNKQKKH